MADIDQKLLAQQKELHEARLSAQNDAALSRNSYSDLMEINPSQLSTDVEPVVSIAQATAARDTKKREPGSEEPEEMEEDFRTEQLAAKNREAADQNTEDGALEKARKAKEQIEKIQKTMKAAKTGTRTVNFTSAATIIGLIITFLVMNFQLVAGNIFGATWVPKLEVWEMVLIGVVDFILWLAIMAIIGIIGGVVNPVSV